MMIHTKEDVLTLIQEDEWMMDALAVAEELQLKDWCICAGFVRGKIWDTLHGFQRTELPDIDVVYYDATCLEKDKEKEYEHKLHRLFPGQPWSVKNQARMHAVNQDPPYDSTREALSRFPETATALGVRLNQNKLELIAPFGVNDAVNLLVRPTPAYLHNLDRYHQRMKKKNWQKIWPNLTIQW
ncbi:MULTISPECIES: nucleotidyltransferase family protein [Bacillaceae]|uniref:Nucleotidyltransferase family protein n=1 Tax=Alkalicoccobacillus plakortidis TaxID=444060 RepID=A0A9D5DPN0_9BACI|nr:MULTISPECIES: nucleotidyltransferase family protein [Bacillaceae]KQL56216.1 hypothetical protein AN965_14955 [Alkalicoccobacillus plakortidis]